MPTFTKWVALVLACLTLTAYADTKEGDDRIHDGRGFFVLGKVFSRPNALNAQMSSRGLGEFKDGMMIGGQGIGLTRSGLLAGVEGYAMLYSSALDPGNPSTKTSLTGAVFFLDLGVPLTANPDLRIYPMIGLGAGAMDLSIRDQTPSSFGAMLDNPKRDASATRAFGALNLSMNLDYLLRMHEKENRTGGLAFGLKAGYIFTFARSGWKSEDVTLTGGPESPIDGFYVSLMIGGGGRGPGHDCH